MDPITWGCEVLKGNVPRNPSIKPVGSPRTVLQMFLESPNVCRDDLNKIKAAVEKFVATQKNPEVIKICKKILKR